MGVLSARAWLNLLTPEERRALKLPDTSKLRFTTPGVMEALAALVEQRKRDIDTRMVLCEFYKEYGDQCSDARAIASIMAERLRARCVEREGCDAVTADKYVNRYVLTSAFTRRLNRLKEKLSRYRRFAGA